MGCEVAEREHRAVVLERRVFVGPAVELIGRVFLGASEWRVLVEGRSGQARPLQGRDWVRGCVEETIVGELKRRKKGRAEGTPLRAAGLRLTTGIGWPE